MHLIHLCLQILRLLDCLVSHRSLRTQVSSSVRRRALLIRLVAASRREAILLRPEGLLQRADVG
eukprot:2247231-Pleurochrysis_carterae.AAC.1